MTEPRSRMLFLNSTITPDSTRHISEEILKINKEDDQREKKEVDFKREPIQLIMDSYGGQVYCGMGLVAIIKSSKTPVHTYVYGYAMSMGLLIAASGHKRYASELSTFMYHQVAQKFPPHSMKLEDVQQSTDENLRMEKIYDGLLISKSKVKQSQLDEYKKTKSDWFIPSDEALILGIVDEII